VYLPKVSISLSRDIADSLKQNGKSLNEVVKEIVIQYARRCSRIRKVDFIYDIIVDINKQLESESNIYNLIGQVKALIKMVETLDLTKSERVYLNTLDSILDSTMTMDISGCRLTVVKTLLSVILLYIVSLLQCDNDVV
jgi:hypothetical protein